MLYKLVITFTMVKHVCILFVYVVYPILEEWAYVITGDGCWQGIGSFVIVLEKALQRGVEGLEILFLAL